MVARFAQVTRCDRSLCFYVIYFRLYDVGCIASVNSPPRASWPVTIQRMTHTTCKLLHALQPCVGAELRFESHAGGHDFGSADMYRKLAAFLATLLPVESSARK